MFANTAKTAVLLAAIGGLLVAVGSVLGGPTGAVIGLVLGLAVCGASWWASDRLALRGLAAQPVPPGHPLHAVVAELAGRAGLPTPAVYVIDEPQPNAFATGRSPQRAVVAVTTGLLQLCDEREVRGVVAHELSHIRHRDILIGSVAAAVATGISFIANIAMFAGMFGGGDDEDAPNPLATLLLALLARLAASILQMAISRSREFEADRGAAALTGDPEALASALLKLEARAQQVPAHVHPAQASAYIVNPLTGRRVQFASLFMTHPPVPDRVARLRSMAAR